MLRAFLVFIVSVIMLGVFMPMLIGFSLNSLTTVLASIIVAGFSTLLK